MENSVIPYVPTSIPRDSEGYVKTFTLTNCDHPEVREAREFFDEFGFVVIADVFTAKQCDDTISDIWNTIESLVGQSVRNDDKLWNHDLWKKTGLFQEGIIGSASIWTRQSILNRQTPALHAAFSAILGTEHLLVNHSRYAMFRPTREYPERASKTNLHLDLNPWNYFSEKDNHDQQEVLSKLKYNTAADWMIEGNEVGCAAVGELYVQGLVNLADNREEDGGFWLLPGFHKYLSQWTNEHQALVDIYGPFCRFNIFSERDVPELYASACHISSRAGSAILWDQRMMHGSRANCSHRPRYAQFFKMFPAEHSAMTPERAEYRRKALLSKLDLAGIDSDADLSPLGRKLFGLEK